MKRSIKPLIISVLCLIFVACSDINDNNPEISPFETQISAEKKLSHKDYRSAIRMLKKLNDVYAFNPCSKRTKLCLIYAYYKLKDFSETQSSIDQFLKFYPINKHVDYVLYIQGMVYMRQSDNFLRKLFHINYTDRSVDHLYSAIDSFEKLVKNYPKSKFVSNANKKIFFLKNFIAEHELSIIKFYNKRKSFITVINRTKDMLRDFPNCEATYKALFYMKNAYNKLGLDDQAKKVENIINSKSNK